MSIDYSEKIPNNVDLASNKTLQRALEQWQPAFLDWWSDMPQRPIKTIIEKQKILTAPGSTTVHDAAQQMVRRNVGAIMVVDAAGRLAGIFTERDALYRVMAKGRDAKAVTLAQVMTPHPQTIEADKPVGLALLMMYDGGFRHVPVVSHGKPVGMISARDALGPELQEFESEVQRRQRIGEILG